MKLISYSYNFTSVLRPFVFQFLGEFFQCNSNIIYRLEFRKYCSKCIQRSTHYLSDKQEFDVFENMQRNL